VVIERGDIFWTDLGAPVGSRPPGRRPTLVVQADAYNRTRLSTVVVLAITSNTDLASHPGNVFLPATLSGLPRDSVINVTALSAIDRFELTERVGAVTFDVMRDVDAGLRRLLGL
jgi:mRNA interferase MazF